MNRRFLFPLVAAFLALTGCSERAATPLAPAAHDLAPAAGSIDLTGVLQFATLPDLSAKRHEAKLIRAAEGGFVELNGFRVDIPAGALPADTVVTIDLPRDPTLGKRVLAEFGPHGVHFSQPARISFPLQGVIVPFGAPLEVSRWENGAWTSLGGAVTPDGTRLSGTTPHFSTYSARSGAYTMAGG